MSLPANSADKCTRCGHVWHGVGCGNSVCGCPTAWVEPVVMAPETYRIDHRADSKGAVGSRAIRKLLGRNRTIQEESA